MNENDLRALFADAVAKGAMSQADLDKLVADKIAKGECKASDDKDDDEDKDAKMDADMIDKAATALAEATESLNKAETTKSTAGWEDPGAPDTGATNPETRPPTERKPIPLTVDFENLQPGPIMEDLVKALVTAIGPRVAQVTAEILKAAIGDIADEVKDSVEKATKPQTDRIKALVANAKAQNEMLKGVGDSIKKAATKKQVNDLAKAGRTPPAQPGWQRPELSSLQVIPAPGDKADTTHGAGTWSHSSLQDRIDSELAGLAKGAINADTRRRRQELAQASIELSTPGSDPDAVAAKNHIGQAA